MTKRSCQLRHIAAKKVPHLYAAEGFLPQGPYLLEPCLLHMYKLQGGRELSRGDRLLARFTLKITSHRSGQVVARAVDDLFMPLSLSSLSPCTPACFTAVFKPGCGYSCCYFYAPNRVLGYVRSILTITKHMDIMFAMPNSSKATK